MSRDYKSSSGKATPSSSGSSLLVGIMIGLVLGLGIALGVAWFMSKGPSPFLARPAGDGNPAGQIRRHERHAAGYAAIRRQAAKTTDKPRFDFYKILPGTEEPATDKELKDAAGRPVAEQAKEAFFLQAGAFQNAPDADNLKARIALLGVEAGIQTTAIPDRGVGTGCAWGRIPKSKNSTTYAKP